MKNMLRIFIALLLINTSYAGGPLLTKGLNAIRYQSNTISYKLDRGAFGIFTSLQARTLAFESFKTWEDVTTSTVAFSGSVNDTLPVDVNGSNYLQYTTLTDFKIDGINPIIFDSDGAITEALFGEGASEFVIGFAGSGSNADGFYVEGEAIMNGVFADGTASSYTLEEWKATYVHELGHFIGLDHTQIGEEFEFDAAKTIYVPTMYPFATVNDVPLGALNPDDIAAISALYPEASFATSTGKISGNVTRATGAHVRGANVVAISTGSDSLMNRISTVTDYFQQNNGSFSIIGLSAGSYYVRIEPINPDFTEGSSVGPYSWEVDGLSFINPVSMEYYNSANESGDPTIDDPNAKTSVVVTAGNTTTNIDLVANTKPAGAPLLTEEFDFSGALTSNGWTIHSGTTTNPLSTTAGLTFSGYSNNVGNAVRINNLGGQDVNKAIDEQTGNGTTIYASFLVNVTESASAKTGNYFVHIGNRISSSEFTLFSSRIFARVVSDNVNFGISNTSTATYGATNYTKNTTYLLVAKYTINSSGNDEVKLWVISSGLPQTEESAGTPLVTNTTTGGQDIINAIGLRQGDVNQPQLSLDGIKIGTSWPGTTTTVKQISNTIVPSTIELMQNYPNPFNPTTSIRFSLPQQENVKIKIFDMLGREITKLVDGKFDAGIHEVTFNAKKLSSGTYFYALETTSHREIKRMVLLK